MVPLNSWASGGCIGDLWQITFDMITARRWHMVVLGTRPRRLAALLQEVSSGGREVSLRVLD